MTLVIQMLKTFSIGLRSIMTITLNLINQAIHGGEFALKDYVIAFFTNSPSNENDHDI